MKYDAYLLDRTGDTGQKNTGPGKIGLSDLQKKYKVVDSVRLNRYPKYVARQGERRQNQWIMTYRSR